MALPSGSGLGIGAGTGLRNRPGWEADEVVGHLRESGLEGMSPHLPCFLFQYSSFRRAIRPGWVWDGGTVFHPFLCPLPLFSRMPFGSDPELKQTHPSPLPSIPVCAWPGSFR